MNANIHLPVLKEEALLPLLKNKGKIYVDATLGGGGHLKHLIAGKPKSKFFAFDLDENAIQLATTQFQKEISEKRLTIIHENFSNIKEELLKHGVKKVDGIIVDLGFSSIQVDTKERGFSFQQEGPLDMRMNQKQIVSAKEIVNKWKEENLAKILKEYGEECYFRKIARNIIKNREKKEINSTVELANIIENAIPRQKKETIHPATRSFQAIRIAVNQELDSLHCFLKEIPSILESKGVVSIISFHSLEDRLVKQHFHKLSADCICPPEILHCERCHKPEGKLW